MRYRITQMQLNLNAKFFSVDIESVVANEWDWAIKVHSDQKSL